MRPTALPQLALSALLLAGCTGQTGEGPPPGRRGPREPPPPPVEGCRQPTQTIFLGLSPSCVGCHGEGTTLPAFADLASFEELIAYDPHLVSAGDPGASRLVQLLEGTAEGTYRQMPLSGEPWAATAPATATISMEDVRTWITELMPCEVPPNENPTLTRRLRAGEVRAALYDQLGLSDADFYGAAYDRVPSPQLYPVRAPHDIPDISRDSNTAALGWQSLGGPSYLNAQPSSLVPDATFVSTLVPLSQAWCRMSVENAANASLFRHTTRDAPSATAAADIRANLRYLELRMLGIEATDDEVTRLYEGVFLPYEARSTPRNAWIAVCSALVRHPLWLAQ